MAAGGAGIRPPGPSPSSDDEGSEWLGARETSTGLPRQNAGKCNATAAKRAASKGLTNISVKKKTH